MLTFYEIPSIIDEELKQFEKDIEGFKNGEINPVKFKAIRVAHGVYEQRQPDTYMIRIRCAAGGITPRQLKQTAKMATEYGNGEVHFTTRQEVQIHNVLIDGIIPSIRGLLDVELSSRGGGGNTIRNILTPVDSGISPIEEFDVDPYAMELSTRMIHEPDSWNLPRKFKIAFSHNSQDDSYVQSTCMGFIATHKDGQKGFEVYVAGGMGAKPMVGHQLIDFIPDTQVYHVTKAIKLMFDKHGNRRSKHSSRIKFLWKKLDEAEFKKLFFEEYDKLKDDASLALQLPVLENSANKVDIPVEDVADSAAYEQWKQRFVFAQKQPGLASVKVALQLGDLLEDDAIAICDFLEQFSENSIRCDRGQNMRLRNIPEKYLPNLYNILSGMKQSLNKHAYFVSNMVNCTGASTCKLGICLPRGLSGAIQDFLMEKNDLDLDKIPEFRLNMSGCPNTCGLHHVADLGFFGKIGRKEGEIFPSYYVLAGAKIGKAGHLEYAQKEGEIPAKKAPTLVYEFLKDYIQEKPNHDNYHAYLDARGRQLIKDFCEANKDVPLKSESTEYYTDFGAKKPLSLEDMGTAECSAGMFDMIEVDRKSIKAERKLLDEADSDAAKADILYRIVFAASRMLLVTRGIDAKNDRQIFESFDKHFIETHFIAEAHRDVVTLGKLNVKAELPNHQDAVLALADAVEALYKSMDDSLRFKVETNKQEAPAAPEANVKDFRGVACPMNFVKTKMALAAMSSGEQLEVWLDDGQPIENVPNSVQNEGHKVLSRNKTEAGHWSVVIEKA